MLDKAELGLQEKGRENHYEEFKEFNINRSELIIIIIELYINIIIIENNGTGDGETQYDAILIVQVTDDEDLDLQSCTRSREKWFCTPLGILS